MPGVERSFLASHLLSHPLGDRFRLEAPKKKTGHSYAAQIEAYEQKEYARVDEL